MNSPPLVSTAPATAPRGSDFASLLRERRRGQGYSQMALAGDAGLSQRHLSFLESAKARPSRAMVLQLAEALALPLRERNRWLGAAGFAPLFAERPLHSPDMAPVQQALTLLLKQQEPYPAAVVDAGWNVLQANAATQRLLTLLAPGGDLAALWNKVCGDGPPNIMKLTFHPEGLRPYIQNLDELGPGLITRAIREARESPAAAETLEVLLSYPGIPPRWRLAELWTPLAPVLPTRIGLGNVSLSFITMLCSFGTPLDLTADNLRVECLFPADEFTDQFLRSQSASA
ncbi:MAG: helix-turn-helix domain-containing protein [Stagnimonas sp.]|nr:helix-turn-helix domain-containing protein [Stagnimonas sp.]